MAHRPNEKGVSSNTIRAIIDPRFDRLLNRTAVSPSSNQLPPEIINPATTSSTNFISSEQLPVKKINPVCKYRLQGLLIGLLMTILSISIVLAVLLTRSTSTTTTTSTMSPCNKMQWNPLGITLFGNGSNGSLFNQLYSPLDVFLDINDMIYIADTYNHRILNIQLETNGSYIERIIAGVTGVSGVTSTTLNTACAIYVDAAKNLYIADTVNCRVQFWPYNASNGSTVAGSSTGPCGNSLSLLNNVFGLYVDKAQNMYISDFGNHRVVMWPFGASTGILVAGNASSQLNGPLGVALDSINGVLYISDYNFDVILAWPLGATSGKIIAGSNATNGNTPSLFNYPWGILRDIYGNIYVSDIYNHRIQKFCRVGTSYSTGTTIAGIGLAQFSSTGLYSPAGIAFDSQMNLYVADSGNHRIQKFLRIQ